MDVDIRPIRVLSLCSGIGGIELGLKLTGLLFSTVCYCEREAYNCAILIARMQEKALDEAPIWTDLRTFDGKPWRDSVDCITGGFPCQPFSIAGKKLADKDPRHLWPDIRRIIGEVRPKMCFFENVSNLLRLGFEEIADDLRSLGYQVKAGVFSAEEVGATHKRERLFILAYADSIRCDSGGDNRKGRHLQADIDRHSAKDQSQRQGRFSGASKDCEDVENANSIGCTGRFDEREESSKRNDEAARPQYSSNQELDNTCEVGDGHSKGCKARECSEQLSHKLQTWPPSPTEYDKWRSVPAYAQPAVHRMADGLTNRVDRVRACGNGVVPLVGAYAITVLGAGIDFGKIRE